jgi:spore maturation protein SpmB
MVLFLAINSSAITLLPPLGTIAVRAAADSADPWAIWMPTLFATTCSTTVAVLAYILLSRLPVFAHRPDLQPTTVASDWETDEVDSGENSNATIEPETGWRRLTRVGLVWLAIGVFIWSVAGSFLARLDESGWSGATRGLLQHWTLPALLLAVLLYGFAKRVRIYDSMVEGGREALGVAVRIVPYLVIILVAVSMFRASGALGYVIDLIDPWTSQIGVPAEALPMAFIRPLSGSGALGVMSEIITVHGPDSFIGLLTSTLMGSTETTFYVLAIYLGAAGVVDGRHALLACLAGDFAGFFGAVAACHFFFG